MRVLAIGAHPDDIEIACAGTLLKCKARGDEVFVCHLSNGDLGHEIIERDELGLMRRQEAKNAGSLGGFNVIWGGFTDLCIFDNKEAVDKVVKVIRDVDPDFIITHNPDDYMPDHTAASKLVFSAAASAAFLVSSVSFATCSISSVLFIVVGSFHKNVFECGQGGHFYQK